MPSSMLGFITTDFISFQISQVAYLWWRKHTSLNADWLNRYNIIMDPSLMKVSLVLLSSIGGLILPTWSHACQQLGSDAIKDLTVQHPNSLEDMFTGASYMQSSIFIIKIILLHIIKQGKSPFSSFPSILLHSAMNLQDVLFTENWMSAILGFIPSVPIPLFSERVFLYFTYSSHSFLLLRNLT